jgi:hypothetical protein
MDSWFVPFGGNENLCIAPRRMDVVEGEKRARMLWKERNERVVTANPAGCCRSSRESWMSRAAGIRKVSNQRFSNHRDSAFFYFYQ